MPADVRSAAEEQVPPVLVMVKLLKLLPPLLIDCAPVPLKFTVPPLWVNVPEFVKLPVRLIVPVVDVSVPTLMLSEPKVTVPLPRFKVALPTFAKSWPPAMPEELKVILPVVPILLALPRVIAPL